MPVLQTSNEELETARGRHGEIDVLGFWGKARPRQRDGFRWHPLAFHCLDVAAVGEALLTRNRGLAQSLSRLLRLRHAETVRLLCFLALLKRVWVGWSAIVGPAGAWQAASIQRVTAFT